MKITNKKWLKSKIVDKILQLQYFTTKEFIIVEFDEPITEFNVHVADTLATNTIFSEFDSLAEFSIADDQSDCESNQIDYKITLP